MTPNLPARSARSALAFVASAAMVACGVTARSVHAPVTPSPVANGAPRVVVDTLAQRWATLEITRAQMRTVWERWAPQSLTIDDQITAVQEQLIAASDDASTPRRALQSVLDALDARQAALAATHRQLLVTYLPSSTTVATLTTQERLVEQRRVELRTSLLTASQMRARP